MYTATAPLPVLPAAPTARPAAGGHRTPPATRWAGLAAGLKASARPVGGLAILGFLVWRLGTGPFLSGVRMIDGWALLGAVAIGVPTTVAVAWRWTLVAHGLGLRLRLRTATADYYRSVFLNATLPGGVLGDVHRAVRHGRDEGDVSRGIRAVVWERLAGLFSQLLFALVVLLALPSPVRDYMPAVTVAAVLAVVAALLVIRLRPSGTSRAANGLRTARTDLRDGLLARGNWVRIAAASAVAVCGHLATFLLAARTVGATAPLTTLIPLTLLALLAMGVPANVGGFGPREGVAAWAFGAAGLTAAQGVSAAIVYGALVLVASLPGAAVLLLRRRRHTAGVASHV